MGTAGKRSFVLTIIAALKSFCVFFSQQCYAGGASPVCLASMQEQIKSDTACCCLSTEPQIRSLSDIVSFSVPLLQCSYSFSCALIVSHCAALSFSHSALLSLSLCLSNDIWQRCAHAIGQHLEAGCQKQRGPATYGNTFSLTRAFAVPRIYSGFPLLLKEIPQNLFDFYLFTFDPFSTI